MNKNIELKKNCMVLFILNIGVLLSLILFKTYFSKVGYVPFLVNSMLVINVIILIIGIIFNVILLKKPNFCDDRKSLIVMIVLFFLYVFLNTIGVVIINKPLSSGYKKMADRLSSYCDTYVCDRYETVNEGRVKDFIIKKNYLDYNGVQNEIEIHTKYDMDDIISIEAIIYSENEMFSEVLIKEQVKSYYDNFGVTISDDLIKKAFDNRFDGSVKKDDMSYKVSEIYEDGELTKLKTVISLKLKHRAIARN